VTMAVSVPNFPVPVVDEQFRSLILRDLPCSINGLGLRVVERRQAFIALAADAPLVVVRYHMLVSAHG